MTAMTYPAHLQPTRSISRARVILIHLLGPADSWDNPLVGTKYDPRLAQHRHRMAVARRRARAEARASRTQPVRSIGYSNYDSLGAAALS